MALHVNEFFDKDKKGDLKNISIRSICFDNVFLVVFLAKHRPKLYFWLLEHKTSSYIFY